MNEAQKIMNSTPDYNSQLKAINNKLSQNPSAEDKKSLVSKRSRLLNKSSSYNKELGNYKNVKHVKRAKHPNKYLYNVSLYTKKLDQDLSNYTEADAEYKSGKTAQKVRAIQNDEFKLDDNAQKGGLNSLPEIEKYQELIGSNLSAVPYDKGSNKLVMGWIRKDVGVSENSISRAENFGKEQSKLKTQSSINNVKKNAKKGLSKGVATQDNSLDNNPANKLKRKFHPKHSKSVQTPLNKKPKQQAIKRHQHGQQQSLF